ncbi:Maturase K [Talaromyces islandicus]|uniref:Maturase K n=1 Tax=Talaromyces islandicus TaxID=28573 RepID=A0A0U1M0A1_TALIS|nr:Maturase K [Talaromyces islandicus]
MQDPQAFVDPNLTEPDLVVLQTLYRDISSASPSTSTSTPTSTTRDGAKSETQDSDHAAIDKLQALNTPSHPSFEPTVLVSCDLAYLRAKLPAFVYDHLLQPYIAVARRIVRVETDVVMLTHLILYFSTSVPSALLLYRHFTYPHAVLHWLMQSYYVGTYTLMMHQHIHMGGILSKNSFLLRLFDTVFPYITNPLMGHTWNSYYYHHIKHHHVEGNGPDDLSSTLRYQRDSLPDFLHYVLRFMFLVWIELPMYFFRKGKYALGLKAFFWDTSCYLTIAALYAFVNPRATVFAFILPLAMLRVGLMVGNWGQHALVDEDDPTSDLRSSITLIDVASNRFCYNDGYHTSHHLNPRRHWRDHPLALLRAKPKYQTERALIFKNIDYIMITVKLLQKDYMHLAKCLVPIGDAQIQMSLEERAAMLRTKTRRFSEEAIRQKYGL